MTSEYKKAVKKVGDADGDWWEWHEYLFDSSGSWSEIMEDPLSFLPQVGTSPAKTLNLV